jgi:hypothetical protein
MIKIDEKLPVRNVLKSGSLKLQERSGPVKTCNGIDLPVVLYSSVSQTVVRRPQVFLEFCPYGPLRLHISPKKTEKIKINVNCISNAIKQFAFKGDKSRGDRRTFWLIKVVPTWKKFEKRCSIALAGAGKHPAVGKLNAWRKLYNIIPFCTEDYPKPVNV